MQELSSNKDLILQDKRGHNFDFHFWQQRWNIRFFCSNNKREMIESYFYKSYHPSNCQYSNFFFFHFGTMEFFFLCPMPPFFFFFALNCDITGPRQYPAVFAFLVRPYFLPLRLVFQPHILVHLIRGSRLAHSTTRQSAVFVLG